MIERICVVCREPISDADRKVTVLPKRPQHVVRSLHLQRSQIGIAFFADS
jgi:hypothetical protein